jgi:hypothetical protein
MKTGELNHTLEDLLLTIAEWLTTSQISRRPLRISTSQQKGRGNFCYCLLRGI